jgi:hypothetical protein
MARNEGAAVLHLTQIGELLVELRQCITRGWDRHVTEIGFAPKVARRLQRLGSSWWARSGLDESTLSQLPADLMKLEWLCRLSPQKLRDLLFTLDCKKAVRQTIIDAVQASLGFRPTRPILTANDVATLKRHFSRLIERVDRARARASDEAGHQGLDAFLLAAAEIVRGKLAPKQSPSKAGSTARPASTTAPTVTQEQPMEKCLGGQ